MQKQHREALMNTLHRSVNELFEIRNQFSPAFASKKILLLETINAPQVKSKQLLETFYHTLLFILAYPDNKTIYQLAEDKLTALQNTIKDNENIQTLLYNSGVTGSLVCAQFSFEIVKWLRIKYQHNVYLDSIAADDARVLYILSAIMPQVESEILQDENSTWKQWLKQCTSAGDDLLDTLINLFDQSPIRPEVKDELWNSLSIYINVRLVQHTQLPDRLLEKHFHKTLIKKTSLQERAGDKPTKIKITLSEAQEIIECGRMILVRHSKEIDPISFSEPAFVSYYQLQRGLSIALLGMRPERRHPIDCYMGYIVFKNGLPLAYAGSWVLFDSARIALNIFPSYRGGESAHTFEQILKTHQHVYRLKRFSVDPYQIGKHNSDGIKSASFWMYYKFGFRHLHDDLAQLATTEAQKLQTQKGYKSAAAVLKKLANGRLELILKNNATVRFDATDLSLAYWNIVKEKYAGNRKIAEQDSYQQLKKLLQLSESTDDANLQYVMKNWCVILMSDTSALHFDKPLIEQLKKLFLFKAQGSEEDYMRLLQSSKELRKLLKASALDF